VSIVPWLLGWSHRELGAETRKSFEVALHAGSAVAWLLSVGSEDGQGFWPPTPRARCFLALAAAPAGAAGLVFERPIERRLGTPVLTAAGLVLGGLVMAAADRAPQDRRIGTAGAGDALWLGAAQAAALLPGISRTGGTLAAARFRGFERRAAWRLSARVGTPVIGGAGALKLIRLLGRRPPPDEIAGLLGGAGASFGSTLLAARLLRPLDRGWPLGPFAAYRMGLALAVALRLRRTGRGSRARPSRASAE
jgi:undecaprenyl-diphosphatase